MEIIEADVLELAKAKILELAYTISKKINLDTVKDEQVTAGQLCSLVRVLEVNDSLLTSAQRQQIVQGIITIGNLNIL